MTQQHPLVGTAVWIRKNGKIMLAKRAPQKKSGAGTWAPPGGHLEMLETIEECVIRETREEASIEIDNIRLMTFVEDIHVDLNVHYVTFHYVADWKSGEPQPQVGESEEWHWFDWDELPAPLFVAASSFLKCGIDPLEFTI